MAKRKKLKGSHLRQVCGLHKRIAQLNAKAADNFVRKWYWHNRAIRAEYRLRGLSSAPPDWAWLGIFALLGAAATIVLLGVVATIMGGL